MKVINGICKFINCFFKSIINILISIIAIILWLPFKMIYPIKIIGKKNLRSVSGGKIFVCNHFSNLDVILLFVFLFSIRKTKFLSKKELGENKIIGWLLSALGAIFIDRNKLDRQGIRQTTKELKKSKMVTIFPEGTRNKTQTDDLQSIKSGVLFFANTTDSYIIPSRFYKRPRLFKKNYIIIGEPYKSKRGDKIEMQKGIDELHNKMEKLKDIVNKKMEK